MAPTKTYRGQTLRDVLSSYVYALFTEYPSWAQSLALAARAEFVLQGKQRWQRLWRLSVGMDRLLLVTVTVLCKYEHVG